jgi:hypothetical protein
MSRPRKKFSFTVSAEAADLLEKQCSDESINMDENIRLALTLLAIARVEIKAGNSIGVFNKSTGAMVKESNLP